MSDLALAHSRAGSFLVATPAGESCVRLYEVEGEMKMVGVLRCHTAIMSTTVSQDASSLLVHTLVACPVILSLSLPHLNKATPLSASCHIYYT